MKTIVHIPYTAQYTDPIRFAAGEPVRLTGKEDAWEGRPEWRWLWAIDAAGREGWMAADFIEVRDGAPVARADYVARELDCHAGDTLTVLATHAGWYWAQPASGEPGWVPIANCKAVG